MQNGKRPEVPPDKVSPDEVSPEAGLLHDGPLLLQCSLLSAFLLFIDIALPLGIAGGIFHVLVVLLALRSRDERYPLGFALLGSLLTLAGLGFSAPLGAPWMVYSNRAIALLAIWATALLGLRLKRYQARLYESETRFQLIADKAPLMIWRTDSRGDWDFISQGWLDFTGRPLVTEQGHGWLAGVHPNEREATRRAYARSLAQHCKFDVRCRLCDAQGRYRWVVIQGVTRPMEGQAFAGFIGTAVDISQRVETEIKLEETRQKYYHREKMAMIGTLAGGMLHEIGNPTAAITGLLQEALDELGTDTVEQRAQLHKTLLEMQNQVERITRANLDIINFTRLQDATRDLQDLNQLIDSTCRLIRHDERMHAIKLTLELDASLPAMEVVADHIVQLLFNLLENAIDACQGVANAEIRVTTRRIPATAGAVPGVELSIQDTGSGIPAQTLNRLKELSFATHPAGKEYGLALCKAIAEEYQGDLEIESEPGKGTEARVTLGCAGGLDPGT